MKERGIIMSGGNPRLIIEDLKLETRRNVKLPRAPNHLGRWEPTTHGGPGVFRTDGSSVNEQVAIWHTRNGKHVFCPYGVPGDRLWVRETWAPHDQATLANKDRSEIYYRSDDPIKHESDGRWRPSIHMPRWASRITLELNEVHVERLQEITEEGARAEGMRAITGRRGNFTALQCYQILWISLHGPGSWDLNPWVWVLGFKKL